MKNRTDDSAVVLQALSFTSTSPNESSAFQRSAATLVACLIVLVVAVGCASTKVTNQERQVKEKLTKPGVILVHDFATTAAEVPADSTLAREFSVNDTVQTPEQIAAGHEVSDELVTELVDKIRGMGMASKKASAGTIPQINDIVIRGYLVSIEEGSAAKRLTIGFGAGGSELKTVVEGYQMTAQGLRKLGSATVQSGGNKTPGASLGAVGWIATGNPLGFIVTSGVKVYGEASGSGKVEGRAKKTAQEIADVLEKRFKEEGWID